MSAVTLCASGKKTRQGTAVDAYSEFAATRVRDYTTEAGARDLADRIRLIWKAAGHKVDAWPVRVIADGIQAWGVQSDLLNGMPSGLGKKEFERRYGRGAK